MVKSFMPKEWKIFLHRRASGRGLGNLPKIKPPAAGKIAAGLGKSHEKPERGKGAAQKSAEKEKCEKRGFPFCEAML